MQTLAVAVSLGVNLSRCKPAEMQTASTANQRHCKPAGLHPLRSAISAVLRRIVVFSWALKIDPARSANLQTVQTSVCTETLARFCGAAPRSSRGAGRTRRPCGSPSDLVGRCCGEGVALQGACRPWGKRYTASGGCVAPKTQGFCGPTDSLTTDYVTLLDAAVSSWMRGGCPLSSTTMIVNACRQRRHAVGRTQPSSWQITFHGT
jgi:hypothetical protein